ncbi:MAG TPA: hypothetical protein PL001_02855 [Candidatus Kryptobacter bacterium]|nr:hypothetical protein [Candidatus Kryptobacter bacterium]
MENEQVAEATGEIAETPAPEVVEVPEGEAVEKTAEQVAEEAAAAAPKPEDEATKKRNREQYEQRKTRKEIEALKIENARLDERAKVMQEMAHVGKVAPRIDPNARPVPPDPNAYETNADAFKAQTKYLEDLQDWNFRQNTPQRGESPEVAAKKELAVKVTSALDQLGSEYGEEAVEIITSLPQSQFTNNMRDAILENENAVKILGHLAENPKAAEKIAAMSIPAQVREIDKLGAALVARKQTSAPAPITPVTGRAGDTGRPLHEVSSMDEYASRRKLA